MKIKKEKKFTLPQLIEWAWDNPKRHEIRAFIDDTRDFGSEIYVQERNGFISIQGKFNKGDTFTVEVEEEITEDMVFNNLIHIYKDPENSVYTSSHENISINDIKSEDYLKTTGVYIVNEDSTLTLVWYNGKLIKNDDEQ